MSNRNFLDADHKADGSKLLSWRNNLFDLFKLRHKKYEKNALSARNNRLASGVARNNKKRSDYKLVSAYLNKKKTSTQGKNPGTPYFPHDGAYKFTPISLRLFPARRNYHTKSSEKLNFEKIKINKKAIDDIRWP